MCLTYFFGESQASIDKAFNNTTRVETESSEVGGITVTVSYNYFTVYLVFMPDHANPALQSEKARKNRKRAFYKTAGLTQA